MDLDPDPDVMAAVAIGRDLENHPLEADAVVGTDGSLMMFTEDVIEVIFRPRNGDGAFSRGRLHELVVKGRQIDCGKVSVGGDPVVNPLEGQLFDKPILVGLEGPLASSPGLGGVRRDHLRMPSCSMARPN